MSKMFVDAFKCDVCPLGEAHKLPFMSTHVKASKLIST